MRGERQLKAMWNDPRMKELIDSLWREYPGLYNERYNSNPATEPAEAWLLNIFNPDIEFGQALGQDHSINGNQSTAIGMGGITRALREMILGSYPTEDPLANPDEWIKLDRLITVGKGIDDSNRDDALILFKSGLLKLFSAVRIGAFPSDEFGDPLVEPEPGTLQFTEEKGMEIFENDNWNKVGDKTHHHIQSSPSRVWEAFHNLNKYPTVSIRDFDGNEYEAEVKHLDQNNTLLTFSEPFTGLADFN
jgi:hypothetical protein